MRKPSERLSAVILAAALLFAAPAAHARFTRLFGKALKPKNNADACTPKIQKELKNIDVQRWGPVQFDCKDGTVWSLYVATDSPVALDIGQFAETYWKLFGEDRLRLLDTGTPWATMVRKRRGLSSLGRQVDAGPRPGPNGGLMYFVDLLPYDSIPEDFAVEPGITKETAIAEGLKIAAKRGHLPNLVQSSELVIRNQCLKAFVPQLVWWIKIQEAGNRNPVSCFIEAKTGKACEPGCSSSSDPFTM